MQVGFAESLTSNSRQVDIPRLSHGLKIAAISCHLTIYVIFTRIHMWDVLKCADSPLHALCNALCNAHLNCFHKKTSLFRILTCRRQPDTAAPCFEVTNDPYCNMKDALGKAKLAKNRLCGPQNLSWACASMPHPWKAPYLAYGVTMH